MTDNRTTADLETFLAGASIDDTVATPCPDCRALLIAVSGLSPNAGPNAGESLLAHAEQVARELLSGAPVEELPPVAAWRKAYRAFGAKPQRPRNSLEALTRRAGAAGSVLPRVNALTDLYNATSVIHQVPLGGEDLTAALKPVPATAGGGGLVVGHLPGFDRVEKWLSPEGDVVNAMCYFGDRKSGAMLGRFPQHREAKGDVVRWYDGYRIVVSDVRATYGGGRLPAPAGASTVAHRTDDQDAGRTVVSVVDSDNITEDLT